MVIVLATRRKGHEPLKIGTLLLHVVFCKSASDFPMSNFLKIPPNLDMKLLLFSKQFELGHLFLYQHQCVALFSLILL